MLLFTDGFDMYGPDGANVDANMQSSLYQLANNVAASNNTPHGRGFSVKIIGTDASGFRRVLNENTQQLVVGFAAMWDSMPRSLMTLLYFENIDISGNRTALITVGTTADGRMAALTGGSSTFGSDESVSQTVIATSDINYFPANTWVYIEAKAYIYVDPATGNNSGHLVVRVNNNLALIADWTPPAVLPITAIWVCPGFDYTGGSFGNLWVDDMYCCDNLGGQYNDFVTGPITVYTLLPNADAGPNAMTQVGGASGHWSTQITQMTDVSYVWTTTVGVQERYTVNPPPSDILAALAVTAHVRAERDSASNRKFVISLYLEDGLLSSASQPLSTTYSTQQLVAEASPLAGAWKISEMSLLEVGFQVTLG